jgi:hypothetical protein
MRETPDSHDKRVRLLRLPLVLQDALTSDDLAVVAAAAQIAALPSPDPLCPFCVTINALAWPEYASLKLCAIHLPLAGALQCQGWNTFTHHQRLAAMARWGRLPDNVVWWPAGVDAMDPREPLKGGLQTEKQDTNGM